MIVRNLLTLLEARLDQFPAVGLLGPRQAGKTTLALEIAKTRKSLYLDLESPADRARLSDPEAYLRAHRDTLVILDEVQRAPDLFQPLRGLIDSGRREGRAAGQFLLLGSASIDLLRQSGESLAGRIAYLELTGFTVLETGADTAERLWIRGGFPDSYLARDDADSLIWRENFIRTYLERDIPQLGPRVPAETLRRLWTMLAHAQGGLANAAQLARGLGVTGVTIARYLDLLVDLMLVRRLEPLHRNTGKRLIKSPKLYVRDSGVTHALLGLKDRDAVLGHPVAGPSWEGFVIECLLASAPASTRASFYRTSAGAEIDLVLETGGRRLAVEIKRSTAPRLTKGFHTACDDIQPDQAFAVHPGADRFPLGQGVEAISLHALCQELASL